MLFEERIYENGTNVFIFKYVLGRREQDTKHFIRGIITNQEKSKNIFLCKNPLYVMNYTVLGEDGKEYFGNMGSHVLGDHFFMTKELYISLIEKNILKMKK